MKPEARQKALAALVESLNYNAIVLGEGALGAGILFVSEKPSNADFETGIPFSGRDGSYLESLLELIQLKREDVYITTLSKCQPLPTQTDYMLSLLQKEIDIIDPHMVILFGRSLLQMFFPDAELSQTHGESLQRERLYMPLFHPATVLRNPKLKPVIEDDFRKIKKLLAAEQQDQSLDNLQQLRLL